MQHSRLVQFLMVYQRNIRHTIANCLYYKIYILSKERNSSRVFCWSRKHPSMTLVTVDACDFSTPRITMHRWLERGGGIQSRCHQNRGANRMCIL